MCGTTFLIICTLNTANLLGWLCVVWTVKSSQSTENVPESSKAPYLHIILCNVQCLWISIIVIFLTQQASQLGQEWDGDHAGLEPLAHCLPPAPLLQLLCLHTSHHPPGVNHCPALNLGVFICFCRLAARWQRTMQWWTTLRMSEKNFEAVSNAWHSSALLFPCIYINMPHPSVNWTFTMCSKYCLFPTSKMKQKPFPVTIWGMWSLSLVSFSPGFPK